MEKILIIDTNQGFTSDLERNLIINEVEDMEVYTQNSVDKAITSLSEITPDKIVMPVSLLSDGIIDCSVPVYTYAKSNEEILSANQSGIPCFGIIIKAKDLLACIEKGEILNVTKGESLDKATDSVPKTLFLKAQKNDNPDTKEEESPKDTAQNKELGNEDNPAENIHPDMMKSYMQMLGIMGQSGNPLNEEQIKEMQRIGMFPFMFPMMMQNAGMVMPAQTENLQMQTEKAAYNQIQASPIQEKVKQRAEQEWSDRQNTTDRIAEEAYQKDIGNQKKKAKCITIYSAKGGVGKTTISCELATFLALTSRGRSNMKVCIADFNIDFGDVLATLSFDAAGANMTTWAEDIRERIAGGENPDRIDYPQARIMTWLQRNEKDGLYALLAPISNADSMEIDEKEIAVMLRNLTENCGFDFVICDTGNNTRDSSFIALEKADEVFLVLTQSVNTANCNNSMLKTCAKVGFDMDKISLIINMVKPSKYVGVTLEELLSVFKNPNTGRSYPCIAQIRDNMDIKHSGNLGEPLAYHSSHEFTKSIGGIVRYLTKEDTVFEVKPEKKKGFLLFLRRLFPYFMKK